MLGLPRRHRVGQSNGDHGYTRSQAIDLDREHTRAPILRMAWREPELPPYFQSILCPDGEV